MVFEIEGKGKITIDEETEKSLSEWYLSPKDDIAHEQRNYVNAEWFHERLKGKEKETYMFFSQINHTSDNEEIEKNIKEFEKLCDEELGDCGFDTAVYLMEYFVKEACHEPTLHWW